MRKSQKRTIEGTEFTVTPFSATEGLGCLVQLTKLVGGSLGALKGNLLDMNTDDLSWGQVIGALADRLEEHVVMALIKRLLANTHVLQDGKIRELMAGGDAAPFEVVFQGRFMLLFEVLKFVLEVNYDLPLGGTPPSDKDKAEAEGE